MITNRISLGETLKDYDQAALKKAMLEHHYDWQYLLYVVALHRYLKTRLPHYDYNRDFGGVVYAFFTWHEWFATIGHLF